MPRRPIRREQALFGIDLPGLRLTYLLKRSSARRGLALKVNAAGQAQVNAPLAMPLPRIEAFLHHHADWLRVQLERERPSCEWRHGMRLPYLGGEVRLAIDPGPADGPREGEVAVPPGLAGAGVIAWYRAEARRVLGERLAAVCRRLGLVVPAWRLSDARTRWGSLSAKGVVGLNWRLVKASPAEIDYVICHELAHFRHRNHSPAFWQEVARLCPDYRAARARLRAGSAAYMAF